VVTPTATRVRRDRFPGWAAFGLIRLGFWLLTAFTVLWYPEQGAEAPFYTAGGKLSSVFFGTFEHWDADYFLQIAKGGYDLRNAAFMPAFPALVHALAWVTGSVLVAGVLIAFGGAIAGVAYACRIAAALVDDAAAYDTAILYGVYPAALVFTAPYSEGLFLFAAAGSLYFGSRGKFWPAGLLAGLAVATRVTGFAVVPALLVMAWPYVRRQGPLVLAPILGLPLAAIVAVSAYYDHTVGDALAFIHAKDQWGREIQTFGPFQGAWLSAKAAYHGLAGLAHVPTDGHAANLYGDDVLDFVVLLAAIALTVIVFRRLGLAWGVYSTGVIALATAAPVTDGGEVLQSLPRYVMVDFPLFIVGASFLQRGTARRGVVLGALTAVAAIAAVAFSRKLWVA
jgi:hypothetical protein